MWSDVPVEVGLIYEGERIRGKQMHVELGGAKIKEKFELVQAREMNEIEDEKVKIVGPDLKDMEEGSRHPIGILVEVAGELVERDLEAVLERRIHEFSNYIQGTMHLNQRYDIWCRVSKAAVKKGFDSFKYWGVILNRLYKTEFSKVIEKIQTTFYTDPKEIKPWYEKAMEIYDARDARARGMKDEEVEDFYGCTLCQSFAPTHVCTITPQRISLCGAINWFDARAAAKVDPKGPNFKIEKGECLDEVKGEFTGINEITKKKSLGEIDKVHLYTILSPYNHTSCGCFEAIAFFIPEVDGIGVVDRNYRGPTVNGLPFSTMANSTGGGKQVEGFVGIAIEYLRSPKLFSADGGWQRMVWLPSNVKERVKDSIPEDVVDKIATEKDASDLDSLKAFLQEKNHPVVENWPEEEEEEEWEEEEVTAAPGQQMMYQPSQIQVGGQGVGIPLVGQLQLPPGALAGAGGGNWKITLKGAKIIAEEMIIKRVKPAKKKRKKK
ncbi:MAG: CO dehydrogenase/CO-methylating acetyl-CoA synthase complex subunit beta [Candidatus Lokiarchaeota archaeon]|nr:CO dehydrogenase/CO-methylating acetyl-CoA synthase complex subunit beta [Candidatus Lokiarchaeota archaeon]